LTKRPTALSNINVFHAPRPVYCLSRVRRVFEVNIIAKILESKNFASAGVIARFINNLDGATGA
jgi:hypothetical protein